MYSHTTWIFLKPHKEKQCGLRVDGLGNESLHRSCCGAVTLEAPSQPGMPFGLTLPALMFILEPAELYGYAFLICLALALMSAAGDSAEVRKCRWPAGALDFQINPRVTLALVHHCP